MDSDASPRPGSLSARNQHLTGADASLNRPFSSLHDSRSALQPPPVLTLHTPAGANSIFNGDKLLTTANPEFDKDQQLFERLGLRGKPAHTDARESPLKERVVVSHSVASKEVAEMVA